MRYLLLFTASIAFAQDYDLILRGGRVIDPKNNLDAVRDVAVKAGKIAAITLSITGTARHTADVKGLLVTPGLVDIHAHVFAGTLHNTTSGGDRSIPPDQLGPRTGVTTMVDAGSAGWRRFPEFRRTIIDHSQTRVLAFLNIVGIGILAYELEQSGEDMDPQLMILRYALSSDIYSSKDKDILDAFSDAPNFNRWMSDTIRPYLGRHVLEIGAGTGNLTRVLAPARKQYIAADLDWEHLVRLKARLATRPNLEVARLDASCEGDFVPFQQKMDTVVCLNVLEHIVDDLATFQSIYGTLIAGGRAVILVPEGQSLYCSLDEELGHCRRYSEKQLQERMERAGFVVEAMIRFIRISLPGWWFNGKILRRRTISRVQLKNFDRLVWIFRKVDALLPWNPTSIIAIGRKPTCDYDPGQLTPEN